MRVVVVDDEASARRRLQRLLGREPDVEVVGQAATGHEALACIERTHPDAVFLDIRMPGLDGLTLARLRAPLPPIVFVTAHDEHAVAAFEVNAVDYLLKPVRPERLRATLARLAARDDAVAASRRGLAAALSSAAESTRVVSSLRGEVRLFDARAVSRFWASDKYTLFIADGEEQVTEEPLSALAARLAAGFHRVHRAELVNLARIKTVLGDQGRRLIVLDDGQRVRVSRRQMAALRTALGLP